MGIVLDRNVVDAIAHGTTLQITSKHVFPLQFHPRE